MTTKKTESSPAKKAPRMSASAARAEGEARTKRALANARATVTANLKKIDAAEQENAKKRDARNASTDGLTASEHVMTRVRKTAKRVSAIDAAATVLASAKQPMRTKTMIEQMAAKGLWTSPGGKTPEATLYSAILREIGTKKNDARFKKVDCGMFTSNGNGA